MAFEILIFFHTFYYATAFDRQIIPAFEEAVFLCVYVFLLCGSRKDKCSFKVVWHFDHIWHDCK